jgi:uncharacterized glyoxalase superfamily protein PhnB
MTEARSVECEVEVDVDPGTAFTAFTDEMDLWWVRSPISFYDSARAVARRCEPGVGGRLLEVYDEATGDALELGRITVWLPGERLAWDSSVDDVAIDVRFDPSDRGTMVRLEARIPAGGQDKGGTSWIRVTPAWFGAWCAKRDAVPHEPVDLARLGVAVYYDRPATAARWLVDVFGLEVAGDIPAHDDESAWIEFHVGNGALMLFKREGGATEGAPTPSHVPWVFVDDLDAHFANAQAKGATIVEPIHQHGYRAYVADDLEGHRWTICQARPTM